MMRMMVNATRWGHRRMFGMVCVAAFGTLGRFAWTFAQGGAGYELTRSVIASGGNGTAVSGEFEVSGLIGQPTSAALAAGEFTVTGGFVLPLAVGDATGDGFVGPQDAALCLTGPSASTDEGCVGLDADGDGDVDLQDVAQFQNNYLRP